MTVNQLKSVLYERIALYWGGAAVVWSATNKVKPHAPLVVLRLGTVTRPSQPVTQMINGVVFSAYPSESSLQIDLFTRGNEINAGQGQYAENTAVNDMLDFVNFIDSTATVEWSSANNIGISLISGVQDLSEVVNDSQWQYRAMVELGLAFTAWTAEYNGVLSESSIIFDGDGLPTGVDDTKWRQTASGGGTEDLAKAATGSFDGIPAKIEEDFS